jgi:hypothetical protein
MVFLSLFLALIPLLGVVWIALHGGLLTVDGLFMSLILLAISGTLGTTALFDLKKKLSGESSPAAKGAPRTSASAGAGLVQQGRVEKVDFFESNVGQPNKSIVLLSNGSNSSSPQMLVFEGDLRNALPTGRKVEITFRKASGYNVLVNVSYS